MSTYDLFLLGETDVFLETFSFIAGRAKIPGAIERLDVRKPWNLTTLSQNGIVVAEDGEQVKIFLRNRRIFETGRVVIVSEKLTVHQLKEYLKMGVSGYSSLNYALSNFNIVVESIVTDHTFLCPEAITLLFSLLRNTKYESTLTDREKQILKFIVVGFTNGEIAKTLSLSVETIKTHISHLYSKLDVHNRSQAINKAIKINLID